LSESAAKEAVSRRFQFNILHPASGLKVDVIVPPDTDFARMEATRIRRISTGGDKAAWFGSPEDVLLSKLIYYQLSGGVSENHLRDIAGMMKLLQEELDRYYINEWAAKLGVAEEWKMIKDRVN
jgi:hypothetical protein